MRKLSLMLFILLMAGSAMCQDVNLIQSDMYGIPYLKQALINAETRYQAGGPGVTEEEIITFHNHIVDVLKLPDYEKLDHAQVRHDRMLLFKLGALGGISPKPGESTAEITHTLSPMAAAILEDHLILQKRFNAGYQMAPGEWTEQKMHEHAKLQVTDPIEGLNSGVDKTKEVRQKMKEKGSLTVLEAAKLLHYLSETFKFSNTDEAEIALNVLEGK